jgi:hypothetical protein
MARTDAGRILTAEPWDAQPPRGTVCQPADLCAGRLARHKSKNLRPPPPYLLKRKALCADGLGGYLWVPFSSRRLFRGQRGF